MQKYAKKKRPYIPKICKNIAKICKNHPVYVESIFYTYMQYYALLKYAICKPDHYNFVYNFVQFSTILCNVCNNWNSFNLCCVYNIIAYSAYKIAYSIEQYYKQYQKQYWIILQAILATIFTYFVHNILHYIAQHIVFIWVYIVFAQDIDWNWHISWYMVKLFTLYTLNKFQCIVHIAPNLQNCTIVQHM